MTDAEQIAEYEKQHQALDVQVVALRKQMGELHDKMEPLRIRELARTKGDPKLGQRLVS